MVETLGIEPRTTAPKAAALPLRYVSSWSHEPDSNRRTRHTKALHYRYAIVANRALDRSRTDTLRFRKPPPYPLGHERKWSEWRELNTRPLRPERSALPLGYIPMVAEPRLELGRHSL